MAFDKGAVFKFDAKEIQAAAAALRDANREAAQAEDKKAKNQKREAPQAQPQESQTAQSLTSALQSFSKNSIVQGIGGSIASGGALSGSGLGQNLASGALGLAAGGAGLVGGPLAGAIAGAMSQPLELFIERFFNKQNQIESQAASAVTGQVQQFAARGIEVGDAEIKQALETQRAIAERSVNAMRQVARVQDETSGSIEGMIGGFVRRGLDAVGIG